MAMVIIDASCMPKTGGLAAQVRWQARSEGRRPLGAALHSPDEPSELSQWPGYDDSTINIVVVIIIIIIIKIYLRVRPRCLPENEQETRLSLTNRATRLKVSQGHKHGTIPYVMY